MSGPDGSPTKRDARRNARRAQFEIQQTERRRERERRIRRQRVQTYAIIVISILIVLLVGFLIIHAVIGSGGAPPSPHHSSYTSPVVADMQAVPDGQLRPVLEKAHVAVHDGWTSPSLLRSSRVSLPIADGGDRHLVLSKG